MTAATKHTPGPWVNDGRGTLRGKGGRPVVVKGITAAMLTTGGDHPEEEANAAVMMAGADLFDALCLAHDYLSANGWDDDPRMAPIRAAIAKAEPRS